MTKSKIQQIKNDLEFHKAEIRRLNLKSYEADKQFFMENKTRPLYENRPPDKINRKIAHETQTEWRDSGYVGLHSRKNVFLWFCKFCNKTADKKYIATGHDHTDYSYDICDCAGARKFGKHYDLLN